MIKIKLIKVIASSLILASILALNPLGVSAASGEHSTGWLYKVNNSWATGWKQIDGKWHYFYSDGYMAHDTIIDGLKIGSDGAWISTQPSTTEKTSSSSTTTTNISTDDIVDVTVENAQEFVNAIGSNKRIILKPGVYNLSSIEQINKADNSVAWKNVYDGEELNLQNIHNLTIEGMTSGKVEIKVQPRFANIIRFTNVSNITIKNIIAGHTPAPYECNEGVLEFINSNDISIQNSELYGCGSIGLNLTNVKRLNASNCTIDHCSLRALEIYRSEAITFTENKIVNHEAYSNIVDVNDSKDITFKKCEFADNNKFSWSFIEASGNSNVLLDNCVIKNNLKPDNSDFNFDKPSFFKTSEYSGKGSSKITIKDSEISNNKFDYLLDNKENVTFENCNFKNNTWK